MASEVTSRSNGRKRTQPSFLLEDNTPSDPALFSSDPPDPSAEHYFVPRPKKQYRGTWWQNEKHERRARKAFERNMDSGIFMGSDSSYETLDAEAAGDLENDDTVPDKALDTHYFTQGFLSSGIRRPVRISEPPVVSLVRKRIAYFAEDGSVQDADDLDEDIKSWFSSHYPGHEGYQSLLALE